MRCVSFLGFDCSSLVSRLERRRPAQGNTARAHELRKTQDWVVIYGDGHDGESTATVVTASHGALKGLRVVRRREVECETYCRATRFPTMPASAVAEHAPFS